MSAMAETPYTLAADDPMRPYWEQVLQARLQEIAALRRLLGIPQPPPRRRGREAVRLWRREDEDEARSA